MVNCMEFVVPHYTSGKSFTTVENILAEMLRSECVLEQQRVAELPDMAALESQNG